MSSIQQDHPSSIDNPNRPPSSSHSHSQTQSQTDQLAVSAFTASLHSLGANYTSSLVDRAKTLHENQAALKKQEDQLSKTTADLARQNREWEKVADSARSGLKEIGDVQNWAELIERDLLVVEDVVAALEREEEEDREGEDNGRGEDGGGGGGGGGVQGGNIRSRDGEVGRDGDGDVDMVGANLNANVHAHANGNVDGKVDAGREEGVNGKGKGKGKAPEKKGWFWWW